MPIFLKQTQGTPQQLDQWELHQLLESPRYLSRFKLVLFVMSGVRAAGRLAQAARVVIAQAARGVVAQAAHGWLRKLRVGVVAQAARDTPDRALSFIFSFAVYSSSLSML